MKIKLMGRPGHVVQRGATIITVMESHQAPPLPDDLPDLSGRPVPYTIYIAEKQWRKAAPALQEPQHLLMVEGECYYDAELRGLVVLAQNVTTRLSPQARKPAAGSQGFA